MFWIMILWSTLNNPNPYILHIRYPTQEMCESDGKAQVDYMKNTAYKCEEFLRQE